MNDVSTMYVISFALFIAAIAAVGRADAQGKAAKNYLLKPSDKVHHELAENGWEIVAVVSIAVSVMLGFLATVFWIW